MKCERCEEVIPQGEQFEHRGKVLCEDCYNFQALFLSVV
jgi:formylmethanofuran dehydrogenase subunit E